MRSSIPPTSQRDVPVPELKADIRELFLELVASGTDRCEEIFGIISRDLEITEFEAKEALWELLDEGKLELSSDRVTVKLIRATT